MRLSRRQLSLTPVRREGGALLPEAAPPPDPNGQHEGRSDARGPGTRGNEARGLIARRPGEGDVLRAHAPAGLHSLKPRTLENETLMDDVKTKQRDLDRLRDTRGRVADRLETIRSRTAEIREELAALAVDGDPEERARVLREERRELDAEREELEGISPVLASREEEALEALRRAAVEDLAGRARKVAGGLAGEHPRHVGRAEEWEQKAADARAKAEAAAERARALADALAVLAVLTGVDTGSVKTVPGTGGRTSIGRHLNLGNVRRAAPEALRILKREDLLTPEAEEAVEAGLERWTPESEQRWRERDQQEERDARALERAKVREEVDAWLRDVLKGGPVLRERVFSRAKAAGITLNRDPYQGDVLAAKARIGAVPVEREGDDGRATWWWIPPAPTAEPPEGWRRFNAPGPSVKLISG